MESEWGTWLDHAVFSLGVDLYKIWRITSFISEDDMHTKHLQWMQQTVGAKGSSMEVIGGGATEDRAVLSSLCHHSAAVKCIVNVQATHDHD